MGRRWGVVVSDEHRSSPERRTTFRAWEGGVGEPSASRIRTIRSQFFGLGAPLTDGTLSGVPEHFRETN